MEIVAADNIGAGRRPRRGPILISQCAIEGVNQLARLPLLMIKGLIGPWERCRFPFDDRVLSS